MLLFILIFLGFFSYSVVQDEPGRFMETNDIELTQPDEAAAYVQAHLGQPLPESVVVLGVYEGGFQDAFVRVKMIAPDTAIPALYSALNVDPTSMYELAPNPFPSNQTWWDIETHDRVWQAPATIGTYYTAAISMVPDPADSTQIIIYLSASDI